MAIDLSAHDNEGPEPGTTCRNIRDDHYCGRPASAKPDGYMMCPECRGHWARLAERDARHYKAGTPMGVYTEELDVATDAPVFATVMDDGSEVRWTLWTRAGADDAVTVLASGEADSVSEGFALARGRTAAREVRS